jgi:hypothetical protein
VLPQRRPDVALRRRLSRQRLFEPAWGEVVADLPDLTVHRLVRPPVGFGKEVDELPPHRLGVGTEQQVTPVGGGEEVMRVAPDQRELRPQLRDQLRLHHAEEVGAGGRAEAGGLGEGILRLSGAADGRLFFQHDHAQPPAGEQGGGDQAVVSRTDHHDVRRCMFTHRGLRLTARRWPFQIP